MNGRRMTDNIYERAIEVLHERGHGKGSVYAVCIEGALSFACHGSFNYCCDLRTCGCSSFGASDAMKELERAIGTVPSTWNDLPERTAEDVVLLLKYAAADELATWRELYGPGAVR